MGRAKQLQQIQIGKETTWGTVVAQTDQIDYVEDMSIQPVAVVEPINYLGKLTPQAGFVERVSGTASLTGMATYEDIVYWLNSVLEEDAAPTGAGPYVWAWLVDAITAPTQSFYTLAYGDGTDIHSLLGALVDEITLTIAPGRPWGLSVNFTGRSVVADTLDAVAAHTVNLIKGNQTTVSLATLGGSYTALNCDALNMSLTIRCRRAYTPGLGRLDACQYSITGFEVEGALSAEISNATTKALMTGMLGVTPTIQHKDMKVAATDGTNICEIVMPIQITGAPSLYTDADGMLTLDFSFRNVYAATSLVGGSDNFIKVDITNQLATL